MPVKAVVKIVVKTRTPVREAVAITTIFTTCWRVVKIVVIG